MISYFKANGTKQNAATGAVKNVSFPVPTFFNILPLKAAIKALDPVAAIHMAIPRGEPEIAPCHTAIETPIARIIKEKASFLEGSLRSTNIESVQANIGSVALII